MGIHSSSLYLKGTVSTFVLKKKLSNHFPRQRSLPWSIMINTQRLFWEVLQLSSYPRNPHNPDDRSKSEFRMKRVSITLIWTPLRLRSIFINFEWQLKLITKNWILYHYWTQSFPKYMFSLTLCYALISSSQTINFFNTAFVTGLAVTTQLPRTS